MNNIDNIDNLTFGELKQIAAMFNGNQLASTQGEGLSSMVGKKCIIRTYSAGVWFGEIAEKSGNEVIVKNARRMWRWFAAKGISLSEVSIHGIDHGKRKIAESVDSIWIEAIELIPCTEKAIEIIEAAGHAKA